MRSIRNQGILALTVVSVSLHGCMNSQNRNPSIGDTAQKPNIIILFADDQGYGDLGCFGSDIPTPNLDRMAGEGMRFTDFYVPAPSCAPSRNALMTGCYPARNFVTKDKPQNAIENATPMSELQMEKLHPVDRRYVSNVLKNDPEAILARHTWGLPESEVTMAEMLKSCGYSTVMYGKWHLGEFKKHHPTKHGFDEYWGVPQSVSVRAPSDNNPWMKEHHYYFPMQPLFANDSIIEFQSDSSMLTKRYTEHAVEYIRSHSDSPFFMWLSYAMPHVPIGASEAFEGKTGEGLYADVVAEIDWSVGEILRTLKETGMERNTLVFYTSDNGPWLAYGDHAGSAKPLREGKGTLFEGGVREPTIAWWPGTIPEGEVNRNPAMTIDLFPTFASLAGGTLPENEIDGKDILPMFLDAGTASPQEAYYFFKMGNLPEFGKLVAVRKGDWKFFLPYHFKTAENVPLGEGGMQVVLKIDSIESSLFNLKEDVGERKNLLEKHKDIAAELRLMGESFQNHIEANQRGVDWVTKDFEPLK